MTEASPMQFPPNATKDESNYELNLDGSRSRRLGMDVYGAPVDTNLSWASANGMGKSSYLWEGPGSDASKKFLVVQTGQWLRVFDATAPVISSAVLLSVTLTGDPNAVWSYAPYGGKLYIVNGSPDIEVLTYNSLSGTLFTVLGRVLIRDLFGV